MTQKKRAYDSLKSGRDARPVVEPCERIAVDHACGTRVANVFHTSAQAKIMISSGGTRGSLSNQKRIFNSLEYGKAVLPEEMRPVSGSVMITTKETQKPTSKKKNSKENEREPVSKKKKKSPGARAPCPTNMAGTAKPVSNLSISTKERIAIVPLDNTVPPEVEAKLGLRSIRILHKFITNSSKITFNVRNHQPVTMKLFQGYGTSEREIGTLISY